ncbi:MAG: S24/S26 family peptidase [Planctomycetes bacterium]|nr:S24/S26 family peptidase [Planctomycetota bacterium]
MRASIERYVDRVLREADLAPRDARRVRAELLDHLDCLADVADESFRSLSEEEVMAMLEKEFGDASELGRAIARAKGRLRTYIKKRGRGVLIALAVAFSLALFVRWQMAEVFRMAGDSMGPIVPAGSWFMVNKWSALAPGDLVVCRGDDGRNLVAKIEQETDATITLSRERHGDAGPWPRTVPKDRVIGRVWLVAR